MVWNVTAFVCWIGGNSTSGKREMEEKGGNEWKGGKGRQKVDQWVPRAGEGRDGDVQVTGDRHGVSSEIDENILKYVVRLHNSASTLKSVEFLHI